VKELLDSDRPSHGRRLHKRGLFLRQNRDTDCGRERGLALRPLGLRPPIAQIVPGTTLAAVKLCQLCQLPVGRIIGAQGRQSGRSGELVSRHNPRAPRLFEDRLGAGVVLGLSIWDGCNVFDSSVRGDPVRTDS
jgi:hypothetical protein